MQEFCDLLHYGVLPDVLSYSLLASAVSSDDFGLVFFHSNWKPIWGNRLVFKQFASKVSTVPRPDRFILSL